MGILQSPLPKVRSSYSLLSVVAIRRYRVKYSIYAKSQYLTKTREFASLRAAGEWVQNANSNMEFLEIRAIDIGHLNPQEKGAFTFFTEGRIVSLSKS